jgi:hypothetical protein
MAADDEEHLAAISRHYAPLNSICSFAFPVFSSTALVFISDDARQYRFYRVAHITNLIFGQR